MKFPIKDFFSKCDQNPKTIFKKKKTVIVYAKNQEHAMLLFPLNFQKKNFLGLFGRFICPKNLKKNYKEIKFNATICYKTQKTHVGSLSP